MTQPWFQAAFEDTALRYGAYGLVIIQDPSRRFFSLWITTRDGCRKEVISEESEIISDDRFAEINRKIMASCAEISE
jgi:hypothetical protein